MFLRFNIFLIVFLCAHSIGIYAQLEGQKTFTHVYSMEADGDLKLDNKYGHVQCYTWDKDSIQIEVEVSVQTKDEDDTRQLLESIVPSIEAQDHFILINTQFGEEDKGIIQKYLTDINIFAKTKTQVDVNYTIWLPQSVNLNISNRFGNIILEEHTGRNDIELEYGDLRFSKFTQKCNLNLKHGKLVGRSVQQADFNLKNYDVHLKKANDLQLKSSGSEVEIDEIESLKLTSTRDELTVEELGSIRGTAKFSDIEVELLEGDMNLEIENGDMEIEETNGFTIIEINQKSSHIDINVRDNSFSLDADLEKSELSVPNTVSNVSKVVFDEKDEHRQITLDYGSDPGRKIILKGKRGSFTFWD